MSAQWSYHMYEQEALAILEGLMKWEGKLLGRKFTIVTDHKALEFFKNATTPNNRQICWLDYMSQFDYDVCHVPGQENKVADCLSRYYENDNTDELHSIQDYVNADAHLDSDWDDLTSHRILELKAGRITSQNLGGLDPTNWDAQRALKMKVEEHVVEAEEMAAAASKAHEPPRLTTPMMRQHPYLPYGMLSPMVHRCARESKG